MNLRDTWTFLCFSSHPRLWCACLACSQREAVDLSASGGGGLQFLLNLWLGCLGSATNDLDAMTKGTALPLMALRHSGLPKELGERMGRPRHWSLCGAAEAEPLCPSPGADPEAVAQNALTRTQGCVVPGRTSAWCKEKSVLQAPEQAAACFLPGFLRLSTIEAGSGDGGSSSGKAGQQDG